MRSWPAKAQTRSRRLVRGRWKLVSMARNRGLLWSAGALCAALMAGAGAGLTETSNLGIFSNEGSVGQTPPGCQAHYDAAKGEYRSEERRVGNEGRSRW